MHATQYFCEHITKRFDQAKNHISKLGYDNMIIDAGTPSNYFEDDYPPPFHANPQFLAYCPINQEGCAIVIDQNAEKPILYWHEPSDFWHDYEQFPRDILEQSFEIKIVTSVSNIWPNLQKSVRTAYLGNNIRLATENNWVANPDTLWNFLRFDRSKKTPFEIESCREANRIASLGHSAVKEAFLQQDFTCEFELYSTFLNATKQLEKNLPYEAIIGLNQKAAILHYRNKRSTPIKSEVLLIDAGVKSNQYASDITRTYCKPHNKSLFPDLLNEMESLQSKLCKMANTNTSFTDIELEYKLEAGRILKDAGIINNLSPEDSLQSGVTAIFAPHSVGHMLGIQTHDVGGRQFDQWGTPCKKDPRFPNLRAMRKLRTSEIVTIEPGIYFIPVLLKNADSGKIKQHINIDLCHELTKYGGIRIEDNILVKEGEHQNLTREFLS